MVEYRFIIIAIIVYIAIPLILIQTVSYFGTSGDLPETMTWDMQKVAWEGNITAKYQATGNNWDWLSSIPIVNIIPRLFDVYGDELDPTESVSIVGRLYLIALDVVDFLFGWLLDFIYEFVHNFIGIVELLSLNGIALWIAIMFMLIYIVVPVLILIKHLPTT